MLLFLFLLIGCDDTKRIIPTQKNEEILYSTRKISETVSVTRFKLDCIEEVLLKKVELSTKCAGYVQECSY